MSLALEGEINLILNEFGTMFKKSAELYATKYLNKKTGKDTLTNSDLLKKLKVEVKDERLVISVLDYWIYVESGRKIGAKNIPLSVLVDWIKKNRIQGRDKKSGRFIKVNTLAFIFQRSIKIKGISKRPFLTEAYNSTILEFDKKLDGVIDSILDDILIKFIKTKK